MYPGSIDFIGIELLDLIFSKASAHIVDIAFIWLFMTAELFTHTNQPQEAKTTEIIATKLSCYLI